MEEKARVVISDPKALKNAKMDLKGYNDLIEYEEDPYKAAHKSHAIAVLTEWDFMKKFMRRWKNRLLFLMGEIY